MSSGPLALLSGRSTPSTPSPTKPFSKDVFDDASESASTLGRDSKAEDPDDVLDDEDEDELDDELDDELNEEHAVICLHRLHIKINKESSQAATL